jgi:hypothetical protein
MSVRDIVRVMVADIVGVITGDISSKPSFKTPSKHMFLDVFLYHSVSMYKNISHNVITPSLSPSSPSTSTRYKNV